MFQNTFHSAQRLDDICAVIVQIPQFAVMALMSPPEGIAFDEVVLFEVLSAAPPLVISQREPVFLKQSVNSRNPVVPGVF